MSKLIMAFGFMWLMTCIAGSVLTGSVAVASTHLTADITATTDPIPVSSTIGFPEPGIIVIAEERIAYSSTTDTTFDGNPARPLERGTGGTTAVAHSEGARVRMLETAMINNSIDYDLAVLADASGWQAFLTVPTAIFSIIFSFGTSPFQFLGTDLQILTAIWGVMFIGLVIAIFISMAGGRRMS